MHPSTPSSQAAPTWRRAPATALAALGFVLAVATFAVAGSQGTTGSTVWAGIAWTATALAAAIALGRSRRELGLAAAALLWTAGALVQVLDGAGSTTAGDLLWLAAPLAVVAGSAPSWTSRLRLSLVVLEAIPPALAVGLLGWVVASRGVEVHAASESVWIAFPTLYAFVALVELRRPSRPRSRAAVAGWIVLAAAAFAWPPHEHRFTSWAVPLWATGFALIAAGWGRRTPVKSEAPAGIARAAVETLWWSLATAVAVGVVYAAVQSRAVDHDLSHVVLGITLAAFVTRFVLSHRRTLSLLDALQRERNFGAAVIDHAGSLVCVFDHSGRIVRFNAASEALSGYRASELEGRWFIDALVPEDERETVRSRLEQVLEWDGPVVGENHWRTRSGELVLIRWVNTVVRNEAGFPVYMIANGLDVTDRRRTEEALRSAEALYRTLVEQLPMATCRIDLHDRVTWVSPQLQSILGTRPGRLVHRPREYMERVHPEDRPLLQSQWSTWREGTMEAPFYHELRLRRDDGRDAWVASTAVPVRDDAGEPVFFQGSLQDITEHRELEAQLRQAQKMDAVGRLAGGVAHDFNNLLTAINGQAELLLEDERLPAGAHERVSEVRQAGGIAAELTRQLLAFSRRQLLQPRLLDVAERVDSMRQLLTRIAGESIRLDVAQSLPPGPVRVDPSQLEQVILNLVLNARDAMSAGGVVTIETRDVELDPAFAARHPGSSPGSFVGLTVRDTGTGMSLETLARAFDPFFTTKPSGTGLGLSTVYGIVKQSGGYVWLEQQETGGTAVHVYLPLAEGAADTVTGLGEGPWYGGSETVLVVEDDEGVRRLVESALARVGYRVIAAAGPSEALAAARADGPEIALVLADVVLPEMAGPALAAALSPLLPAAKLLFMSGYSDDAVFEHGVVDGAVAFMQKPFTISELGRRVRETIDAPDATVRQAVDGWAA